MLICVYSSHILYPFAIFIYLNDVAGLLWRLSYLYYEIFSRFLCVLYICLSHTHISCAEYYIFIVTILYTFSEEAHT